MRLAVVYQEEKGERGVSKPESCNGM